MKKLVRWIGVAGTLLQVVACQSHAASGHDGARTRWNRALSNCAGKEVLGDDVLFFGRPMNVDPGAIWRKTPDGRWKLRWRLRDLGLEEWEIGKPSGREVRGGVSFRCRDGRPGTVELEGPRELDDVLPGLDPSAAADLRKANKISVEFVADRWDVTRLEPYAHAMAAEKDDLKKEILSDDNFIQVEALRLQDTSVVFQFDPAVGTELTAKYKPGQDVGPQVAGGIHVTASTPAELTLAAADAYIAGVFIPRSELDIEILNAGDADRDPGPTGKLAGQLKSDTAARPLLPPEGMFVRGLTEAKIER